MCKCLADSHFCRLATQRIGGIVKTSGHLLLCHESLDDTKAAKGFLYLRHGVAPHLLHLQRLAFQLFTYHAHNPSHHRNHRNCKEGELPTYEKQSCKVEGDKDRVLDKHIQGAHDGALHLAYITSHTGDDVAPALLGEKAQRQ